jgi:hypothetical protein
LSLSYDHRVIDGAAAGLRDRGSDPGRGAPSYHDSAQAPGRPPVLRPQRPVGMRGRWAPDVERRPGRDPPARVERVCGIYHLVDEVDPARLHVGLRVEPVWRDAEERTGSLADIRCFRPVRELPR